MFLVCSALLGCILISPGTRKSVGLLFGGRWMLVAGLTLMLFISCVFAKTDSGTRYAARLSAEAVGRRTPQLTAMRMDAQGPSSYQLFDLNRLH
jgi:hypothetical protein